MTRINIMLLLVLLISSFYLVRVSYDSRRHFSALDRARTEQRQLDNEFERLKAERQAQATPLRVEKVAREKLVMKSATPAVTQYVSYARGAPGALSADAGGDARGGASEADGESAADRGDRAPASGRVSSGRVQ